MNRSRPTTRGITQSTRRTPTRAPALPRSAPWLSGADCVSPAVSERISDARAVNRPTHAWARIERFFPLLQHPERRVTLLREQPGRALGARRHPVAARL